MGSRCRAGQPPRRPPGHSPSAPATRRHAHWHPQAHPTRAWPHSSHRQPQPKAVGPTLAGPSWRPQPRRGRRPCRFRQAPRRQRRAMASRTYRHPRAEAEAPLHHHALHPSRAHSSESRPSQRRPLGLLLLLVQTPRPASPASSVPPRHGPQREGRGGSSPGRCRNRGAAQMAAWRHRYPGCSLGCSLGCCPWPACRQ